MKNPPTVSGRPASARVLEQLDNRKLDLRDLRTGWPDPKPTPRQVATVIRSLADFTHNREMLRDAKERGADQSDFGEDWVIASGLGRYFHALADQLLEEAEPSDELPMGGTLDGS